MADEIAKTPIKLRTKLLLCDSAVNYLKADSDVNLSKLSRTEVMVKMTQYCFGNQLNITTANLWASCYNFADIG